MVRLAYSCGGQMGFRTCTRGVQPCTWGVFGLNENPNFGVRHHIFIFMAYETLIYQPPLTLQPHIRNPKPILYVLSSLSPFWCVLVHIQEVEAWCKVVDQGRGCGSGLFALFPACLRYKAMNLFIYGLDLLYVSFGSFLAPRMRSSGLIPLREL